MHWLSPAIGCLATVALAGGGALAQSPTTAPRLGGPGQQGDGMTQTQTTPEVKNPAPTEATMAYREAATQMHKDMAIRYSGDPDRDFVTAMIAHHQGAVAIAKVQLRYGTTPDMRAKAQAIIDGQERDIQQMRDWLGTRP